MCIRDRLCVVHQIRNSIKYVGSKNQKEFLKDLKCVYQAVNKESAKKELLKLEEKWGEQYPIVIRSWQENWDKPVSYTHLPSVDLNSLSDEDFAMLSEDALWLHEQMLISKASNALLA